MQFTIESAQSARTKMPFSDPWLIGNDNDRKTEIVQQPNRSRHSWEDSKLLRRKGRVHNTGVLVVDQPIDHAIPFREVVPVIDQAVADPVGQPLFGLPVHIHELAKASQITSHNVVANLYSNILDLSQATDHPALLIFGTTILLLQNMSSISRG